MSQTTPPNPPTAPDWRTPQFWIGAIGTLITLCLTIGLLNAAESEMLRDTTAKILSAAGVIGAQVTLIVAMFRSHRGGPPTPPPPGDGLPPAAWFAPLLLAAALAGTAGAQGLKPLPSHTSSGRPIEASSFTPAPARASTVTLTAQEERQRCTWQIGIFNWRRERQEQQRQGADPETLGRLDRLIAQQERMISLLETGALRQQANPPLIVLPIQGQPKQDLPIQGQPKQELPTPGRPKQELPPIGVPIIILPQIGQPKQELPQSAPKQELPGAGPTPSPAPAPVAPTPTPTPNVEAPTPRASGYIRYTLYRPGQPPAIRR